jgi:PAS domain S-box-containing protein
VRVLLAEDNAIARTALAGRLRGEGYEVELAEDGEDALGHVRQSHPDIVIADVLMPRMDGYSLCRAIKSDPALNAIPVVFYSATFISPEDRQLAESVGASRILQKSADLSELSSALREVLDEFENAALKVPQQPLRSGEEIDKFYESVLTSKLAAKVNELEAEKKALRESEQRYHRLVATIPDVLFVLGLPEFNTTYIAPEAERLIGVPGEEVLGDASRWVALVHEEDRSRILGELNTAVAGKQGLKSVFRMYHRQGGTRWIEVHSSMVLDDDGQPREMLGVLTDITERKLAEEKLVESERSLATLFRNLPGMAYRCRNTPSWTMEFVSDGVESVTGYRREELVADALLSYNDLILPEDQMRVWEEVQQALHEGHQFSLSYRIRHKDGKLRWVWERGVGVPDEQSGELWVEGFITDITLRKRAEEQLIESERRYRSLFEMLENGMAVHELVYDAQGKAVDYRFLEVNPAFERLTGLVADNIVGHTVREVMPDIEQAWIDDYINVVTSGEPSRFVRYSAPLDRYYDVVAFKNATDQFVALFSDITEQRKSEETIRNLARFPEENPSPVLRIDVNGVLLYANQASEVMRERWALQRGERVTDELLEEIRAAQQNGNYFNGKFAERCYSFLIRPVTEAGYINIYGRDVTAEHQAQQELVALNRVLQTLSEGNRTLVHSQSESKLLENICRVFTQEGDYPLAWVSVPSANASTLDCYTVDGELKDCFNQWDSVSLQTPAHPIALAFRSGENVIINRSDTQVQQYALDALMNEHDIHTVFLLPIRYQDKVFGVIGVFSRLPLDTQAKELALLDELASDLGYGVQSHRTKLAHEAGVQRLNSAMMHTIEAVSIALEKRDPYTAGHQKRVASLSMAIAQEMGFSEERIEGIRLGSMVHDIGKISVPAEILNRPGRLSKDEFGIIRAHPDAGYDILSGVDFPWPIASMIIQHHERMDGSGYPQGLKGDEIVEEARILAVADVVEAITSHRPYRPSLGLDIALGEIEQGRGGVYDAAVVDACLTLFREKGFEWEEA